MPRTASPREPAATTSADALRRAIVARHAVRVHVALILAACFGVGLAVTKLLLEAGVHAMWLRYAVALAAAYGAFLLGVRIWLRYAGYDRPGPVGQRSGLAGDAAGALDFDWAGGGSGKVDVPVFRGGGGGTGGGGVSARFGGVGLTSGNASATPSAGPSLQGGGGIDLGDGGWVLVLLIAAAAAVFGAVGYILYAAPTILADAAFAGMLAAGLVRPARRIASGGWVASVVRHTWLAFAAVLALALAFALVAQHHFPDARTLADVTRKL